MAYNFIYTIGDAETSKVHVLTKDAMYKTINELIVDIRNKHFPNARIVEVYASKKVWGAVLREGKTRHVVRGHAERANES